MIAAIMTRAIFISSEGWNVRPNGRGIQREAPFMLVPLNTAMINNTKDRRYSPPPKNFKVVEFNRDTKTTVTMDMMMNAPCFSMGDIIRP